MTMQRWPLSIRERTAGDESSVTASTGRLDYYRDSVHQDGLNFSRWLAPAGTGAVLWSHDHHALPVARAARVVRQGDAHRLVFRWLDDVEAGRVRKAFEAGVLGASIGFVPEQTRPNEAGGTDILKATVVEVSLAPIPANPDCVRVLRGLGLMVGDVMATPQDLERYWRAAEPDELIQTGEDLVRHWRATPGRALTPADLRHPAVQAIVLEAVRAELRALVGAIVPQTINRLMGRVD